MKKHEQSLHMKAGTWDKPTTGSRHTWTGQAGENLGGKQTKKHRQSLHMKAGTWVEPTSGSQNTRTEQETRNPPVVVRTHELSRKAETHQW